MNVKKKFVGVSLLAAAGLLASISVLGVVRADVDPQDPIAGDEADATATVEMKQRCQWYVAGVPSDIVLVSTAEETSLVYDGTQFDLTADLEDDIIAYSDGNLAESPNADAHTPCTLFGEQTGIEITGVWSGSDFSAAAVECGLEDCTDANMDFTAGGLNPVLAMSISKDMCRTPGNDGEGLDAWTVGESIESTELEENVISLAATAATPVPMDGALNNDKCNADLAVSAAIPAGQTPLYAGKNYNFTGPTFTTEITIDADR